MGRVTQAITFLLIGAVATGAGAGFFLYQANTDRRALTAQAQEAKRKAEEVVQSGKAVTDEANRKLEQASEEVAKAQARVKALEEEREWSAKAEALEPSRTSRYWKEWLNYSHGFSIHLPTNVTDVRNNANGLDASWISIRPYNNELVALETAYLVDGHLLVGSKQETGWLFRVQSSAHITHLITIRPEPRLTEATILEALSTLSIRDE